MSTDAPGSAASCASTNTPPDLLGRSFRQVQPPGPRHAHTPARHRARPQAKIDQAVNLTRSCPTRRHWTGVEGLPLEADGGWGSSP
jgi:hypothetical protein